MTDVSTNAGYAGEILPSELNYQPRTIMSYASIPGSGPGDDWNLTSGWQSTYPASPMVLDILAAQYLYGANTTHNADDTVYTFAQGTTYVETIWDAGGTDTLVYAATTDGAVIDLRPGAYSDLGAPLTVRPPVGDALIDTTVGIAFGVVIENAEGGGGDDRITGNDAANTLTGGGGNDVLDGGSGTDTVVFSGTKDSYSVSESGMSVIVADGTAARDGTDTLSGVEQYRFSDGTFSLSDLIAPTTTTDGIYRFHNLSTGTHFYTGSADERNAVIDTIEWFNYEGVSFKAATGHGTTDVFRFYNPFAGTHFFTASEAERDSIVANVPQFTFEGTAYQAYASEVDGSTALYRFLNTSNGSHFYTASEAERDAVISTIPSYFYEGIAYYVDAI